MREAPIRMDRRPHKRQICVMPDEVMGYIPHVPVRLQLKWETLTVYCSRSTNFTRRLSWGGSCSRPLILGLIVLLV